jgi:hypothetical protein
VAISVGDHTKATTSGSNTCAITGRTTQATGSAILLAYQSDAGFTSIGDNKGNSYVAATTLQTVGGVNSRVYYCENVTGGSSHNFTFQGTFSADNNIFMLEIVGGLTASILDQANQGTDASSPFGDAISISTTQNDELIVAFLAGNSATTPATHAEGTGFTIQDDVATGGPNWTAALGTRIVTSTGAYAAQFTENGASNAAVHIVSFKAIVAASGTKTLLTLGVG